MTEIIKEFAVNDRLGPPPMTFMGVALAEYRYGSNSGKNRWTDMVLYRIVEPDSPYRYALEIIARSYVYHRTTGPCTRHKARHRNTTVGEVYASNHRWENLIPCDRCKPKDLQDLPDNAPIAEERSDVRPYLCTNASDIIAKLYRRNGEISDLAAKLIRKAAYADPELAQALKQPRRLPHWTNGRPEDIDEWLRECLPEAKREAFYAWVAEASVKVN